jgi:hypothetical protein
VIVGSLASRPPLWGLSRSWACVQASLSVVSKEGPALELHRDLWVKTGFRGDSTFFLSTCWNWRHCWQKAFCVQQQSWCWLWVTDFPLLVRQSWCIGLGPWSRTSVSHEQLVHLGGPIHDQPMWASRNCLRGCRYHVHLTHE